MTIKEIAQLAQVSISTVSKVLNGKDSGIRPETRERILEVARQNHYSVAKSAGGIAPFIIGAVTEDSREGRTLLAAINRTAASQGYSVISNIYGPDVPESEAVAAMASQNLPVVIWQRQDIRCAAEGEERDGRLWLKYDSLYEPGMEPQSLDFEACGYDAVRYLAQLGHRKIGYCFYARNARVTQMLQGARRCCYDLKMEFNSQWVFALSDAPSFRDREEGDITALVCWEEAVAYRVYQRLTGLGYHVPRDISLLTLSMTDGNRDCLPRFTKLVLPVEQIAEQLCRAAINALNRQEYKIEPVSCRILEGETACPRIERHSGKIVVVGSINLDSTITVKKFPEPGQTSTAEDLQTFPGGKGFNQAVAAAKLGARVSLIGKLGQDYEARFLRETMAGYGLNMEGIRYSRVGSTGKAFITVQKNGDSDIIVYPGANRFLCPEDIDQCGHLFDEADFCLLQSESPEALVVYAAKTAKSRGIPVILKPAAVSALCDELLENVDILVPNRKELNALCPLEGTVAQKAEWFLKKGVANVIVTLDEDGCLWTDGTRQVSFAAAGFEAVDTTGAADAFISALAVYLAEGESMVSAIQYATYAAGYSITRSGVQSALIDRELMDAYAEKILSNIRYRIADKEETQ